MSAKSIFIIILTVGLTLILMNNTDDMSFWLFGEAKVPKLAILGGMFFLGWLIGFLMGRPKSQISQSDDDFDEPNHFRSEPGSGLSEENREYIR